MQASKHLILDTIRTVNKELLCHIFPICKIPNHLIGKTLNLYAVIYEEKFGRIQTLKRTEGKANHKMGYKYMGDYITVICGVAYNANVKTLV